MCKESIQLEIIKKKSKKKKKRPPALFFIEIRARNIFFYLPKQYNVRFWTLSKGITFYGNQIKKVSVRSTIAGVPFVFIRGFAFNF